MNLRKSLWFYLMPSLLLWAVNIKLVKCYNLGVEACKTEPESTGCDDVNEKDWHTDSNICKKGAKFTEVVNRYENGDVKMKLCKVEDLDFHQIKKYAKSVLDKNLLPLLCHDHATSIELGIGFIVFKGGYPQIAIDHFNKHIDAGDSPCAAMYYGRAMAYTKLGLTDSDNAAHVLLDYAKALYFASKKESVVILEARAEVFSASDEHSQAYDDYSEAIRVKPSYRLYLLRGMSLVFMEKYRLAYEDLQESLRLRPHQTVAMHYLAMCLFHMRRLGDAIKTFEAILMLKPMSVDIMLNLAQAYRESGEFGLSLKYFRKAAIVQPNNAGLLHNKGDLLYNHGNMPEALTAYRNCASLEPFNSACQFMKATCYASMGQFYPSIKELTKATHRRPVRTSHGKHDYPSTMYLREWCRYLHSHLDVDVNDFTVEDDINIGFKENWSRRIPFTLQNYTEQPGLQPHIKDISAPAWSELPTKMQKLLCYAYNMGRVMYKQGARFGDDATGNIRAFTASGLASIEVSQTVVEYWKARKSYRNKHGETFSWRDIYDIAIKWIRFVEVDNEVFWMDNPNELTRSFIHRFALIQGNVSKHRYEKYFPKFYEVLVDESVRSNSHSRYNEKLEPVDNFYRFLNIEQRELEKVNRGHQLFVVASSKVASKKDHAQKTLDGYSLLLQLDSEQKLMLIMDLHLSWGRKEQFHGELEFIWQKIAEDNKKLSKTNSQLKTIDIFMSHAQQYQQTGRESLINLILSLSYYFFNLFPLARSSTVVSHSTAVGLILALGKEMSGSIEAGKEIHLEALTIYDHEKFQNAIRGWLTFKKASGAVAGFENVAKSFPTFRSMLNVLQYDLSSSLCNSAF